MNYLDKKYAFSFVLLILYFFSGIVHSEVLFRLHGSNTVGAELGPALAKEYLTKNLKAKDVKWVASGRPQEGKVVGQTARGSVSIEIWAHGSSTAFRDLKAAKADVGMASRQIKSKEVKSLQELGIDRTSGSEHVVGLDGIAVVVPKTNKIESLSISQLRDIFSGKISFWQQLGIAGGKIHVYARDNDSGTYDTFKSLVLAKKAKLTSNAKRYESNANLSDDVSRDPNGIGFVGLPYIRESRAVAIKIGTSKARMPTHFNVATEDYALSRRLYMYLSEHSTNKHAQQFIQMVGTRVGQKTVEKIGFISQNIRALDYKVSSIYPIEYQALNKSAQRLSLNFRFQYDSLDMDSRAERDLMRLVAFLQKNKEIKKLMLFGFSEDKSIPIHNIALSEARADRIAYELKKKKVYVHVSRGYGAYDNVASNSEISKNRRVEVWVE